MLHLVVLLLLGVSGDDARRSGARGVRPLRRHRSRNWCERVALARAAIPPEMAITYPCESLRPARSAVVTFLTDGVTDGGDPCGASGKYCRGGGEVRRRIVFRSREYIEGAMALGYSLRGRIPEHSHMLLVMQDDFRLQDADADALSAVGWTIGTVPQFPLSRQYVPSYPRYRTTYTKLNAVALAEYRCVHLLDADTLVVGDLRSLLSCSVFTEPRHRVAGALDYFQKRWFFFNTGALLWKTSVSESRRLLSLTRNASFMKRFSSDQDFLNNVYPDRLDAALNARIVAKKAGAEAFRGTVVPLDWKYNAQTHVQGRFPEYYAEHRADVRVLHFTEKKGWLCERRETPLVLDSSNQPSPRTCSHPRDTRTVELCFCRESHLYWNALLGAQELARAARVTRVN